MCKINKVSMITLCTFPSYIVISSCYNRKCKETQYGQKEPPWCSYHQGDGKEEPMKHQNGMWWYKGESFATLHEALVSVWPA